MRGGALMIVDRYTKAVLTVIAGCLVWICAMGAGVPVGAQPRPLRLDNIAVQGTVQPVILVGTGTLDSRGALTIAYPRHQDGRDRTDPTLPVTLPYSDANPMPAQLFYSGAAPLPVEITAVKKVGEWEPLRAKVEDAPAKPKPGGGDR
jgi:hypothetical protein